MNYPPSCPTDCSKCNMVRQVYCTSQLTLNQQERLERIEEALNRIEETLNRIENLLTKPKEEAQEDAGAENSASN